MANQYTLSLLEIEKRLVRDRGMPPEANWLRQKRWREVAIQRALEDMEAIGFAAAAEAARESVRVAVARARRSAEIAYR